MSPICWWMPERTGIFPSFCSSIGIASFCYTLKACLWTWQIFVFGCSVFGINCARNYAHAISHYILHLPARECSARTRYTYSIVLERLPECLSGWHWYTRTCMLAGKKKEMEAGYYYIDHGAYDCMRDWVWPVLHSTVDGMAMAIELTYEFPPYYTSLPAP